MKLRIIQKQGEYFVQRKGLIFWHNVNKPTGEEFRGWIKVMTFDNEESAKLWLNEVKMAYINQKQKAAMVTKVIHSEKIIDGRMA